MVREYSTEHRMTRSLASATVTTRASVGSTGQRRGRARSFLRRHASFLGVRQFPAARPRVGFQSRDHAIILPDLSRKS